MRGQSIAGGVVFTMFLVGAYAALTQIALVRELIVVFLGNELCLGLILACWLSGIAAGAGAGGLIGRRAGGRQGAFGLVFLLLMAAAPGGVVATRSLRLFMRTPIGELTSFHAMAVAVAAVVLPIGALVGLAFPLAARLAARADEPALAAIGRIYTVESLGSMAGGILFAFVLAGRGNAISLLFWMNAVCLGFLPFALRPAGRASIVFAVPLALQAAALALGLDGAVHRETELRRWQAINPHLPLLRSTDSRYQNLVLTRQDDVFSVFGSGQCMFSFPAERTAGGLAHVALCEHPRPKSLLVIGGGLGGLLGHALLHGLDRIDYVELDPAIHGLVAEALPASERASLADGRVRVRHEDGRRFVKQAAGSTRYDVVLVNMPDPSTAMLNRFYTLEFYREVRRILSPGGVFATHVTSAVNYYGDEVARYGGSVYATLKRVFEYVVVTPGDRKLLFCSGDDGVVTADTDVLARRFEERNITTDVFSRHHFGQYFETPERVAFVDREFRRLADSPVNTDLRPVSYFLNMLLWDRFSGDGAGGWLRRVSRFDARWLTSGGLAAVLARFVYLRWRRPERGRVLRFNALAAIGVTGFAAMGLEMVLLFAYQSLCGYVYERVGLIFAAFMAGLAAGAGLMNAVLHRRPAAGSPVLAGATAGVAGFALLVPSALRLLSERAGGGVNAELGLSALVLVSGLLTGAVFPVANRVYLSGLDHPARAAGMTDCFDHVGAVLGALFTGAMFVPVLGVSVTCAVTAAFSAVGSVFVLWSARHPPRESSRRSP